MAKPEANNMDPISIEFETEIADLNDLLPINNPVVTGNDDMENLKNIEANAADQNKSFDDYYREVKDVVDKSKPNENFKANDYADKRWLAKDYSKEQEYIFKEESPAEKNSNPTDKNSNSKNTYAGNTIITYNLGGRKASRLPAPAYQCLGSGEVNIEINVNQKGVVTSITVLSTNTSLNEACLTEAARRAALSSKFAIDLKAPSSQKGTINYKFVQQ